MVHATLQRLECRFIVLLSLIGCVSVQPRVPAAARPSPSSGYVGGLFAKDTIVGFGFRLQNEQTAAAYVLEIEEKAVSMIAIPPGRYRVASWLTWALTGERLTEKPIPATEGFGEPFDLEPGRVVFLGSWSADRAMGFGSNTFMIDAHPISESEAMEALRASYPQFADIPIRCLLCAP
jgi:hypothetical protein